MTEIQFKSIFGKTYTVKVNPDDTVAVVKEKLRKKYPDDAKGIIDISVACKTFKDTMTVKECNFGGFSCINIIFK
jgi:hypothetical protein